MLSRTSALLSKSYVVMLSVRLIVFLDGESHKPRKVKDDDNVTSVVKSSRKMTPSTSKWKYQWQCSVNCFRRKAIKEPQKDGSSSKNIFSEAKTSNRLSPFTQAA